MSSLAKITERKVMALILVVLPTLALSTFVTFALTGFGTLTLVFAGMFISVLLLALVGALYLENHDMITKATIDRQGFNA